VDYIPKPLDFFTVPTPGLQPHIFRSGKNPRSETWSLGGKELWQCERDGLDGDGNASFSPLPAAIESASKLLSGKTELFCFLGF
jgi:hypothetical protein